MRASSKRACRRSRTRLVHQFLFVAENKAAGAAEAE
jgi:hypothetical protein